MPKKQATVFAEAGRSFFIKLSNIFVIIDRLIHEVRILFNF
jgi:hypothetical protein